MTPFYRENNIIFRIASADALSNFKKIQAHSFLELTRKDIEFAKETREILLLSYDRFSNWLYRMEKGFLMSPRHAGVTEDLGKTCFSTLIEELNTIEEVCERHPDVFSPEIRKFISLIHHEAAGNIKTLFAKAFTLEQDRAYSKMVSICSDYLQYLLISVHEFNNNVLKKKDGFLCVSQFDAICQEQAGQLCAKAKFFADITSSTIFKLKNLSNKQNISDIKKALENKNFTIHDEHDLSSHSVTKNA